MILSFIYDLLLFILGLVALPKLLWNWYKLGKYRESLSQRLGLKMPPPFVRGEGPVIWIHVVSVGETKAVAPLYKKIRSMIPQAQLVISSVTETGFAEAKRSLPNADSYFFLPLDFSWLMKKAVRRIKPHLLILVEGEFWYHLLKSVKDEGGHVALVNGKLSERSAKRFAWASFFTKKLFGLIDCFCLQSSRYLERFREIGIPDNKLQVTGNIKLDASPALLTPDQKISLQRELGITLEDRVVVIGSTHDPEEEWLLSALDKVWSEIPKVKILIVPRHPERFAKVSALLNARGAFVGSYTQREQMKGDERVVLIDAMGLLMRCFQLAEVAIVGGSFTSGIGGHNIFEPVQVGVPVLFGPHMETQLDLVELVVKSGSGLQVSLAELPTALKNLLVNKTLWNQMHRHALKAAEEARGSTERTWQSVKSFI